MPRPVSGSLTASRRLRSSVRMYSVNVSASLAITSAIVVAASSRAVVSMRRKWSYTFRPSAAVPNPAGTTSDGQPTNDTP